MFNLGFTMEELMFPENYQFWNIETNYFIEKFDEISSIDDGREQIIIDDDEEEEDDDWFTIKQLNPNISSINDQILPLTNFLSDNQTKSMIDFDSTIILPNLSIKIIREKNHTSSSSDTILTNASSNQHIILQQEQINKHLMSKSISSLSQSSTSMTNSSLDDSNDLNELSIIHHSTESLSHHHNNKIFKISNRRRRKRTIFTAADIEHLKEAFIQNPKPTQQDIAILSEQLGHDSYVIRVWFYNKRQAAKKRIH